MAEIKKVSAKDIKRLCSHDHREVNRAIRNFKSALLNRNREVGGSSEKNMANTRRLLGILKTRLIRHMAMEEEAMFPILKKFVPKHSPLIRFLRAEHESLKTYMGMIRSSKTEGLLKDQGRRLIYLLKNHGRIENASIYRAIGFELGPDARCKLAGRIRRRQQVLT